MATKGAPVLDAKGRQVVKKGIALVEGRCRGITRAGAQCLLPPMRGRNFCDKHGGRNAVGTANGAYRHGWHSKFAPGQLTERLIVFANNPNLLENLNEIAALDVRTEQLLNSAADLAAWQDDLIKAAADLRSARSEGDDEDTWEATNRLLLAIDAGEGELQIWSELRDNIEQRRKITESERKRMNDEQQMVPIDQLMVIMRNLSDSINKHVTDKKAVAALRADIILLVGGQGVREGT